MAKKASKAKSKAKKTAAHDAAFVEHYLGSLPRNALQAYKKLHPNVSDNTAGVEGCKLLKKPNVAAVIEARIKELQAKYELTSDDVMRSLSQALHFDPRKLYKPDGSLKSITDLDDDTVMALGSVEVVEMEGGMKIGEGEGASHVPMFTKKVKWLDKNTVREQAMKHLGMFEKDREQLGKAIGKAIIVTAKQSIVPDP